MEKQPLLQYYTDETWGYDIWDEESKKREGVKVKFQQKEDEPREDFFKRLNLEPTAKMYGSELENDKKVRDEDWYIRWEVADQGYGLDILVYDEDWWVRCVVATQGYGLDTLVHDKNWRVREAVAKQSYGLDILVYDESEWVRLEVAVKGYGLDALINDVDWNVRHGASHYLQEEGYSSIEEWIEDNPGKCADRKNL